MHTHICLCVLWNCATDMPLCLYIAVFIQEYYFLYNIYWYIWYKKQETIAVVYQVFHLIDLMQVELLH